MARTKRIIEVPHAEPGSFNPDRLLINNTLLLNQVKHFQKIEREHMTEGQASEYVQRMTARLHLRHEAAPGRRAE